MTLHSVTRGVAALGALYLLAACAESSAPSDKTASLRVLNASRDSKAVTVFVDGSQVGSAVVFAQLSVPIPITPGAHRMTFTPMAVAQSAGSFSASFSTGDTTIVIVIDSSTIIDPIVLTDTGSIVPLGASKLRVVHFAEHAPAIDVWRTQPDYQTLIRVMFPFPYRAASGYIQSTPGDWTVVVTPEGRTDTLLATGPITVPDGKSRTVLLLDGDSAGLQARILDH